MNDLLTRLWRLGKPLQWRFLWLMHSKFICGITGVVRDDDGRVLLLRHRLWPADRQWGFPTGYANKGERHEDTIAREVREETALTVKAGRLLKVRSRIRLRHYRGGDEYAVRRPREGPSPLGAAGAGRTESQKGWNRRRRSHVG